MTEQRIRVLVVEDSLTVRRYLVDVLSACPWFEVIGEAADGKVAIELCQSLRPDVVTMDMMLPVMTGVAATEYIMAYCPTPILIVSASMNRGEQFRTYDALAAGAVDVFDKPSDGSSNQQWEERFLNAVRLVSRIRVLHHPRARLGRWSATSAPLVSHPPPSRADFRVVALGASTGGPSALLTILRDIPAEFPLPIIIVLHISEPFGGALAHWLDAQVPLPVRSAVHEEPLPPTGRCQVLMAPPDKHLEVHGDRLLLTDGEPLHSCRPSVDVCFHTLAASHGRRTLGCLLTGMGKDGAAGLLDIRSAGGTTFAQDEASSVVFGMPREAIRIGAATRVLPLAEVARNIVRAVDEGGGQAG